MRLGTHLDKITQLKIIIETFWNIVNLKSYLTIIVLKHEKKLGVY